MSYDNRFKIRVAVVLPMADGLLLCQQNNHPFWVLPGGTLEPGEGVEACAIREMKEETGLVVTLDKLLYVADWLGPNGRQVHELYFLGRYEAGTLRLDKQDTLTQLNCFTPSELAVLPVQPERVANAIRRDWPQGFEHVEGKVLGTFS